MKLVLRILVVAATALATLCFFLGEKQSGIACLCLAILAKMDAAEA